MVQAETPTPMRRFKRQGRNATRRTPEKIVTGTPGIYVESQGCLRGTYFYGNL